LVCDGNKDCENGEDEKFCHHPCRPTQFHCPGCQRCKDQESVCDGFENCEQLNCPTYPRCVDKYEVCDGTNDCGNNEDEKNCTINSNLCTEGMFVCDNSSNTSKCISQKLVCNGRNDCGSNEDEMNCEDYQLKLFSQIVHPGLPNLTQEEKGCKIDEFLCPLLNAAKCIKTVRVCDGRNDCGNNEDEINCNNRCAQSQFFCKSSEKCIPEAYLCDGEVDCPDSEDEMDCSNSTTESSGASNPSRAG